MAAKKPISILWHKISDQKWENLEIWLIIEDCKYNYTAEIKFEKGYSVALLWGKQILNSALKCLFMLISRTCAWSMQIFLPPKEAQGKVRQSQGRAAANSFAFSR